MTIEDLLIYLEELVEEGHGDKDVYIAQQPSYPLESRVKRHGFASGKFYIAAGEATEYGPRYEDIDCYQ